MIYIEICLGVLGLMNDTLCQAIREKGLVALANWVDPEQSQPLNRVSNDSNPSLHLMLAKKHVILSY